jgi:hypothetical protein
MSENNSDYEEILIDLSILFRLKDRIIGMIKNIGRRLNIHKSSKKKGNVSIDDTLVMMNTTSAILFLTSFIIFLLSLIKLLRK